MLYVSLRLLAFLWENGESPVKIIFLTHQYNEMECL